MSSARPNPSAAPTEPEPRGGSRALVAVAIAALAALALTLNPRQPKLAPAPLEPPQQNCPTSKTDFVPTNLTEVPALPLSPLPKAARNQALLRLNLEPCACGCRQSLAECLVANHSCPEAPRAAQDVVAAEKAEQGTGN